MSRITNNTTGTQPVIKIDVVSPPGSSAITLPFVQDVTITNATGVYSYTTFTDTDQRKLSTPANNDISMNIVLDTDTWFGTNPSTGTTAAELGIQKLSSDKVLIYFEIYYAGNDAGAHYRSGQGFVSSLAPKTSPTAPVFVTPITIAVDGSYVDEQIAP